MLSVETENARHGVEAGMVQTFAIPSGKITKQLSFKRLGDDGRKLAISTNWLTLMDFNPDDRVIERSLGKDKGIEIIKVYDLLDAPLKTKKVYKRSYTSRKNNPIETLLEVGSQRLINESFGNAKRVHVIFTKGRIIITPITSHKEQAIKNATPESRSKVFAACTSGLDICAMESSGFQIHSIIEMRPNERRDKKRDLTETGALTALRNLKKGIINVFNEDITTIDTNQLAEAVKQSPVTTFIASPQCDDHTNVKNNEAKEKSVEDLTTTVDMALDMLRVIDAIKPPVVQFENVSGWYTSEAYNLLKIRLRRYGYIEYLDIAKATDRGGLTTRKRGFSVFTCLDAPFAFEKPPKPRTEKIWPIIEPFISGCRDVSHSKSILDGAKCGRLRVITPESITAPSILKSQERMAKDSCVILHEGKYLWPSESLVKRLMGVPQSFSTDCVSKDISIEIVGQSQDHVHADLITRSIKKHIDYYFN